jgi:hypothetical protein
VTRLLAAAALLAGSFGGVSLGAQGIVPPKGEGTVSVTYQNYYVIGHFDVQGRENRNGGTHSKALITELDYGLTDTIGLSVALPVVASRYTGSPSYLVGGLYETNAGPLDNGSYHGAVQDLRVELRRMFLKGPLALAPFAGLSVPTHAYATQGEAVPGRRRMELQLGASSTIQLTQLPHAYLTTRYSYGAAPPLDGFPATHSNIDVEGGYAVTPRVTLRGLTGWQVRHKGPRPPALQADWKQHDRFIVASYHHVGGGASIAVTRSMELSVLWVATVSGHDGAHRSRTLAATMSWSFGAGLSGLGQASSPGK